MLSTKDNELMCRVGTGTLMGNFLRRFWLPVFPSEDLLGPDCDPREVRLLGEDLVAFRDTSGRVGLVEALCPHRRAPLFYGRNEENGLRCIYHGWKFDVEGRCIDMPTEPAEFNPSAELRISFQDKVRAQSYPIVEAAGFIWAYFGPPGKTPELPHLEWMRLPADHRYMVGYQQYCNFVQAMEGDIDSAHAPFLHGMIAGPEAGNIMQRLAAGGGLINTFGRSTESTERGYYSALAPPRWVVEDLPCGVLGANRRDAGEENYYWRVNLFMMPIYTTFPEQSENRGHGHIWIPVDDEHTQVWCVTWAPGEPLPQREKDNVLGGPFPHIGTLDPATGRLRANRENRFLIDRDYQRTASFTGIRGVREQDTAVVEGMGGIVDRTREHLGASDSLIIGMRRRLLNAARALPKGEEPFAATHPEVYRTRAWSKVMKRFPDGAFIRDGEVQRLLQTVVP